MAKTGRNYRSEYINYQCTPEQKKNRAARNKARNEAKTRGVNVDNKDIDHKKPLRSGGSKSTSNTRIRDRSSNRSDNGHKKGETQKKWKK